MKLKLSWKKLLIGLILSLFILLHLSLLSKTFLFDSAGNVRTAFAGYGDIPFHLTQVTKFGYGDLFDLNEPIFTGDKLRYAFFINWISGFFLKITGNLSFSFHLPAMFLAAAGAVLTFLIYKKFFGKEWAALLAVFLFFLGSGFGAYSLISDQLVGQSMSPPEFTDFLVKNNISTGTRWDAVYPQQNIAWGAPLTLVLVHQRAFLLGYFLFTLFFYFLLRYQETRENKYFYSLIAILGLSPLAHYHSFLAMGFTTVLFAFVNWQKKNRVLFKKAILILLFAAVLSAPEILYLTLGRNDIIAGSNSFLQPRLGWMADPTIGSVKYPNETPNLFEILISYTKFLWVNFGIILPLFVFVVLWVRRKKIQHPNLQFYILGALLFFVMVQLFKFQPWDYDNNKLLVYFQFFAAPVLLFYFLHLLRNYKKWGMVLLPVFFILAVHSGIVDIIPRFFVSENNIPVIFSKDAVRMADFIRKNINEDDQILTSSTHLNLVSSLAGRPVILGYPGWLWTKGIDYVPRETDLRLFFKDPDNVQILKKYGIKYILLDPVAINDWRARKSLFDARFVKIFGSNSLILYRIMGL